MSGAICKYERNQFRFSSNSLLSTIWLSCLLIGVVFALRAANNHASLARWIIKIYSAAPQKYMLLILPFLLSAAAVFISRPYWLYCICGIQAVLFSVSASILCLHYGQAGWLAYWMFMFPNACSLPFLYCYWLNILSNNNGEGIRQYFLLLPILALIIVDYRIIAPYVSKFGLF